MTTTNPTTESLALELRLGEILTRRAEAEGGYSKLAKAITACVPKSEQSARRGKIADPLIDRRRLRSLANGELHVVVSVRELVYLDRYLDKFGLGLAYHPLFKRVDTLHALAATGHVTFLLGTKPEDEGQNERQNISHWDTLGMAWIQVGLNNAEPHVRVDLLDVPLQKNAETSRESLKNGKLPALLGDRGPSLVIIGSSRINPAAEGALAMMLGFHPFQEAPLEDKRKNPFLFLWSRQRPYVYESALHLDSAEIAKQHPDKARRIVREEASALAIGNDVYVDDLSSREMDHVGNTYGICAVQRRGSGQVWVVLSGLTGVSTYVAAKLVAQLPNSLHEPHNGKNSPIYWGLVQAYVGASTDRLSNRREFDDERVIVQKPIPPAN